MFGSIVDSHKNYHFGHKSLSCNCRRCIWLQNPLGRTRILLPANDGQFQFQLCLGIFGSKYNSEKVLAPLLIAMKIIILATRVFPVIAGADRAPKSTGQDTACFYRRMTVNEELFSESKKESCSLPLSWRDITDYYS